MSGMPPPLGMPGKPPGMPGKPPGMPGNPPGMPGKPPPPGRDDPSAESSPASSSSPALVSRSLDWHVATPSAAADDEGSRRSTSSQASLAAENLGRGSRVCVGERAGGGWHDQRTGRAAAGPSRGAHALWRMTAA